jgi:hypothetical protein
VASVSFSHDDKPPVDRALEEVGEQAEVKRKPIRIRFQPDLYDSSRNAYTTWIGLTWVLELRDVEEGRRLREGLTWFFKVFGADEKKQRGLLSELERRAVGVR